MKTPCETLLALIEEGLPIPVDLQTDLLAEGLSLKSLEAASNADDYGNHLLEQ